MFLPEALLGLWKAMTRTRSTKGEGILCANHFLNSLVPFFSMKPRKDRTYRRHLSFDNKQKD
eukprot:snap_masked-scaffold_3-processed-gene-6.20-mRNA-1 protein AED:1.00 eAED:1.00 QI:0/0/0/0/1/1/2/0/61